MLAETKLITRLQRYKKAEAGGAGPGMCYRCSFLVFLPPTPQHSGLISPTVNHCNSTSACDPREGWKKEEKGERAERVEKE